MDAINPDEIVAFDMYFATIVGMNEHPGKNRENGHKLTIEGCAGKALAMLIERRKLIPTETGHESE